MLNEQPLDLKEFKKKKWVKFEYTNYKGETAWRHVEPIEIRFGATEWHKEPQWLLKALDLDKKAIREFALKDILHWGSK